MAYPTDLDNFTPKVDNVDDVNAVDVNELQTAIESLETKVGITGVGFNPASASSSANVVLHEDTDNGTNKITVTAPSAIASDKVLTLPDATDTLVGKATTDTLANKTLTAPVLNGALSGDAKATGATITTGTADDEFVTPKALADATVGKLGAAWADWTPTWTNFTPGSATIVAKYTQIGKTVHYVLKVNLNSTTVGSSVSFTLPVKSSSNYLSGAVIGNLYMLDVGTTEMYGVVRFSSTTTGILVVYNAAGTYLAYTNFAANVPFTWANNDAFCVTGTYEAA